MLKILDEVTKYSEFQLLFLQRVIEVVEYHLSADDLDVVKISEVIRDVNIDGTGLDVITAKEIERKLIDFLEQGDWSVEYLVSTLENYQTRFFATVLLGWFGRNAKIALPELINIVSGNGVAVGAAQRSILHIGGAEEEIMRTLVKFFEFEDDEGARNLINLALKTELNSSNDFFELLTSNASQKNPHIRECIADAIWKFKDLNKDRVFLVLRLLASDKEEFVSDAAKSALSKIGGDY